MFVWFYETSRNTKLSVLFATEVFVVLYFCRRRGEHFSLNFNLFILGIEQI